MLRISGILRSSAALALAFGAIAYAMEPCNRATYMKADREVRDVVCDSVLGPILLKYSKNNKNIVLKSPDGKLNQLVAVNLNP